MSDHLDFLLYLGGNSLFIITTSLYFLNSSFVFLQSLSIFFLITLHTYILDYNKIAVLIQLGFTNLFVFVY